VLLPTGRGSLSAPEGQQVGRKSTSPRILYHVGAILYASYSIGLPKVYR